MSLRDELAAVLGPGNDDRIAYDQADSVLAVLAKHGAVVTKDEAEVLGVLVGWHVRSSGAIVLQGRGGERVDLLALAEHLFDAAPERGTLPPVRTPGTRPWRPAEEEIRFQTTAPHQVRPGEVLKNVRRVMADAPRLQAERQARDEALLEWLRQHVPGFVGRLEDGRLHGSEQEVRALRVYLPAVMQEAPGAPAALGLGELQVVVDEEECG